jgi:hypothetical protein
MAGIGAVGAIAPEPLTDAHGERNITTPRSYGKIGKTEG